MTEYLIDTRCTVDEIFRLGPSSTEKNAFVRLSKLSVHSNIDDWIDACGKVYQDVANDVGILEKKNTKSNLTVMTHFFWIFFFNDKKHLTRTYRHAPPFYRRP